MNSEKPIVFIRPAFFDQLVKYADYVVRRARQFFELFSKDKPVVPVLVEPKLMNNAVAFIANVVESLEERTVHKIDRKSKAEDRIEILLIAEVLESRA